jgi:glutamate-ammonia-ligase adenylyltransferase
LARPRDAAKTIDDVVSMRALMARERPPKHDFDLKLVDGGLVDLEFIAQSAQLVAGSTIARPQAPVAEVLARLEETGLVPEGGQLARIHALYSTILQVMSAALTNPRAQTPWGGAFKELLAQLTNYPDFRRLQEDLKTMQAEVSAVAARWYEKAKEL